MRKFLLLAAMLGAMISSYAQSFSINTDGSVADTSAILDVKSSTKGFLLPRMNKAQRNLIYQPATGLLIYQSGPDSLGFHYYDGSQWVWLSGALGDTIAWKITGNSNITASHFLGTTNDSNLYFRIRNIPSGFIDSAKQNTALGYNSSGDITTGIGNTAMGYRTLDSNTTGYWNTALGHLTLYRNKQGADNSGLGNEAMRNQTHGISNTAVGGGAMRDADSNYSTVSVGVSSLFITRNTTGNVAVGVSALNLHRSGNANTAVGLEAMQFDSVGNLNVAIGYRSLRNNKRGIQNTGVGVGSLEQNINGSFNTAMGRSAGFFSDSADNTTAIGYSALAQNRRDYITAVGAWAGNGNSYTSTDVTQGAENTMIGYAAMTGNAFGSQNVAIGFKAMALFEPNTFFSGTSPSRNVAIGDSALFSNRGNDNTAVGYLALSKSFNNNHQSTAVGSRALRNAQSNYPNTAVGYLSMDSISTGYANTAVGSYTLSNDTTGINNTAIGNAAMYEAIGPNLDNNTAVGNNALRKGKRNGQTAIGADALSNDTSGFLNTAIGYQSMYNNRTGNINVSVGAYALNGNTTGTLNTAVGVYASLFSKTGSGNTALGYAALYEDTSTVGYNTATGIWSLVNNKNGSYNLANGAFSGQNIRSGTYNTYLGAFANSSQSWPNGTGTGNNNTGAGAFSLYNNIIGHSNTAIGYQAGYNNDTSWNTYVGTQSGYNTTKGIKNTFVGDEAGQENGTGNYNTYIGEDAGLTAVGSSNVYIGQGTGSFARIGDNNTLVGRLGANNFGGTTYNLQRNSTLGAFAGQSFLTSANNTYLGYAAGNQDTAGVSNVAIGYNSLTALRNAINNTAIGAGALSATTADYNAALGYNAGNGNTTGTANTLLGTFSDVNSGALTNATAVGAYARVDASNSMVLGSINGINTATADTKVGIGTTTPDSTFSVADNFLVGEGGTVQFANATPTMMYMFKTGAANTDRMVISHSPGAPTWGLQYQDVGDQFNFLANGINVMAVDLGLQRVGINNANPLQDLHIGTGTGATMQIGSGETLEDFGAFIIGTNSNFYPITDATRSLGGAANRWVNVYATSGVVNTSDARDKKNIANIEYGLSDLMKLRPVKFDWKKDDGSGAKLGFLAQDLLKVIPEVVKTHDYVFDEKTGKFQKIELTKLGVYYSDLIPVTVKAIQDQQKIIEDQQKQLDDQKKLIEELIKRVEKLENK